MLLLIRIFSILVTAGISAEALGTNNVQVLRDIFASAVAKTATSFTAIKEAMKPEWAATGNVSSWNGSCFDPTDNFWSLSECLQEQREKCISLKDVKSLFDLSSNQNLSQQDVVSLSPVLVYSILSCDDKELREMAGHPNKTGKDSKPSSEASWGYSFLFVTLINLCSLTGALVLPCMKLKSYKLVLMFMVALAVGTLAGSSLLFLMPEAFLLVHDETSDYIWKSTTIMGGVYLFYITEKVMRMINARRENTNLKKKRDELATEGTITTSFRRIPIDNSIPGKDPTQIAESMGGICSSQSGYHWDSNRETASPDSHDDREIDDNDVSVLNSGGGDSSSSLAKSNGNGHGHHHHHHHHHHHYSEVAPVAYMIIFGDALHNFIDGLSIGSAFTQSIMTGISVSVAVMCEELPHELGDFAILLNSGMRFRKAIMYNFLSACTCYLGTIVGILLAENTESHEWIFAVAGGMFLYISFVDMMPEMNTAAESEEGKQFGEIKTFLLQNCGLVMGFMIMLVFCLYGGNIRFD